ncbi:MAG: helix-turn-helix domain-containing protein [Alphaproteobacteria bacterium]|nr:helix-turn-helix domain-containing protein [Alphaproteobacteria bacterium]MCB9928635.1 helix-turn-helix domain-containing protein [Alphaproteobacteria bacterium]
MNIWRHTAGRESLYRPSIRSAARMPDCAHCPVRDHSLCAGMEAGQLIRVAEKTDQLEATPGQALFFEGDPARHFFTIRRGVVRVVRSFPDGRRSVVGFLHDGDFFGGGFGQSAYPATAEAVTDLEYCRITVRDLEELAQEFPALHRQVASMASDRLHAANDHIVLLSRKTAIEKVAAFLLASAEWVGDKGQFDLPMARSDIADYLGLTIETVSRTMTRLIDNQVIALPTPQRVRVLDWSELNTLAKPEADHTDR